MTATRVRATSVTAGTVAELCTVLSATDRVAARRFRNPLVARSFVHACGLAGTVLGRLFGVDPRDVAITRVCRHYGDPSHGKPRYVAPTAQSWSTARCAASVIVAVADQEVWIDLEDGTGPFRWHDSREVAGLATPLSEGEVSGTHVQVGVHRLALHAVFVGAGRVATLAAEATQDVAPVTLVEAP